MGRSKERLRNRRIKKSSRKGINKEAIRREQDYQCADCGVTVRKSNELEIHHCIPVSMGGSSCRSNLIGLCGPLYNDCHEYWDRKALDQGIYCDLPKVRGQK